VPTDQAAGPLRQLIGGSPPRLDLFTLIGRVASDEEGRDALLRVPGRHLVEEIHAAASCPTAERWDGTSKIPAWAFHLGADPGVRSTFADRVDAYCSQAIDPYWNDIRSHLATETAACSRALADGGVERLLNSAHPGMRWRDGALEIDRKEGDSADLQLNGRGLILVPSVFCRRITVYISLADPDGPAVLFYPALRDLADAYRLWAGHHLGSSQKALGALLGDTRAAALDVISTGCTTSELGDRLGLSPATASYHVAVLRDAGMITSHRRGSTVLHTITRLGTALLNGSAELPC
jgi:DNA-binding transcriptional ArsR family regulator